MLFPRTGKKQKFFLIRIPPRTNEKERCCATHPNKDGELNWRQEFREREACLRLKATPRQADKMESCNNNAGSILSAWAGFFERGLPSVICEAGRAIRVGSSARRPACRQTGNCRRACGRVLLDGL